MNFLKKLSPGAKIAGAFALLIVLALIVHKCSN